MHSIDLELGRNGSLDILGDSVMKALIPTAALISLCAATATK
jgi:hypothetical protein